VVFDEPQPLVAPGQTVALYDADDPDEVVGAAVAETAAESDAAAR
jgi:tRNA U34 2-thiouridine synthase MnmA/TrmU